MKKYILFLLFILSFFKFSNSALANLGVGVSSGKIVVDEILKPGMIYQLPSFSVINTGDVSSDYSIGVAYHENQPELQPSNEWFDFSPKNFYLEPGQSQLVEIKLNIPVKTVPGKYFAYLEGFPIKKAQQGDTSVGISAAVKLYFSIKSENIILGMYYFATSILKVYTPWTTIILGLIAFIIILRFIKKHFNINININKKNSNKKQDTD